MEPLRHLDTNSRFPYNNGAGSGSSTTEQVRTAKQKALARPSLLRVIIRVITFAIGASIVVVLAHASAVWYTTRNDILLQPQGVRMRGWPAELNMIPTWLMLAVAATAMVVQTIALLTLIPGIRRLRESNFHTWGIFFTSVVGVAIWTAAAVYFKLQDKKSHSNWTLWSWSCAHRHLVNGKMSFQAMCVELNYCFYIAVVVAVLEIVSLTLFGIQLRKVKREGRGGAGRYRKITVEKR